MNFVLLDIALLIIFLVVSGFFLYRNRANLKKEGWFLLYKTSWGVKLIDRIGKKYQRTLKIASYISIILGVILVVLVFIMMIQTVYLYLTTAVAETIRAPPIMPLIPYFPQIFNIQSIFPPFYFIYFIIAILIVATTHEFFHGIFAARYKVKIKSTGFAFLKYFPAFFGAFVEQDDNQMKKKTKFEQMSILSAGVFANVLMVLIFGIIFILFFKVAFVASGVSFDSYAYNFVDLTNITEVNGINVTNFSIAGIGLLMNEKGFNQIKSNGDYLLSKSDFEKQNLTIAQYNKVLIYYDSPAIKQNLSGLIYSINGIKINSREKLSEELNKYSPGEKVVITTLNGEGNHLDKEVTLGKNPQTEKAWLGVGFLSRETKGIKGIIAKSFEFFKKPNVYYTPRSVLSQFIFDLLWWIVLINFAVALFNMLPLGMLDGGRFFYLGILSVTKSEKFAEKSFKFMTYFWLTIILVLMVKWVFVFFF